MQKSYKFVVFYFFLIFYSLFIMCKEKMPKEYSLVRDWILTGKLKNSCYEKFHKEFPNSPHKKDSENFEIFANAWNLRLKDRKYLLQINNEIVSFLKIKDDNIKQRAVFVSGILGVEEIISLLFDMLESSKKQTREKASYSLQFFGNRYVRLSFVVFGGRFKTFWAGGYNNKKAFKLLLEKLKQKNKTSIDFLVSISEYYDNSKISEALLNLAEDEKIEILSRRKALELIRLKKYDSENQIERILLLTKHKNENIRGEAIFALVKYLNTNPHSHKRIVKRAVELLNDQSLFVRRMSTHMSDYTENSKKELIKKIKWWLSSSNNKEREIAIDYIVGNREEWDDKIVRSILYDPDIENRYICAAELIKDGDKEALAALMEILKTDFSSATKEQKKLIKHVTEEYILDIVEPPIIKGYRQKKNIY